jgi:hypothetical protein
MRPVYRFLMLLLAFLVFSIPAAAQQPPGPPGQPGPPESRPVACPVLVSRGFSEIGTNCSNLDRGEACYGYGQLTATFVEDSDLDPDEDFVEPADRVSLLDLETVQGTAMSTPRGEWSIAVMDLQGNLPFPDLDEDLFASEIPNLANQAITVVQFGDVRLEDGVFPDITLIDPNQQMIEVTVTQNANVRNIPPDEDEFSQVVGTVAEGTVLLADALDNTGDWVRVLYEYENDFGVKFHAWINRAVLGNEADYMMLTEGLTPFQSFYMLSGFDTTTCIQAPPPSMYLQGPPGVESEVIINGLPIYFNSAILVQTFPNRNTVEVTTLTGIARTRPDTEDEVLIPAGYRSIFCLSEMRDLGIDGEINDREVLEECAFSPAPRQLTPGEMNSLRTLANLPPNILNAPASIPSVVCASGVGGIVCEFQFDNVPAAERLRRLCELGRLPDHICRSVAP